jgi:hypothetical protein
MKYYNIDKGYLKHCLGNKAHPDPRMPCKLKNLTHKCIKKVQGGTCGIQKLIPKEKTSPSCPSQPTRRPAT